MIFEIAFPVPLLKTFDYLAPDDLPDDFDSYVGRRVRAVFGFKQSIGIITSVKETSEAPIEKLKSIVAILDEEPVLDAHAMDLARWMARRYAASIGEALFILMPPGKDRREAADPKDDFSFHDHAHAPAATPYKLTQDQEKAAAALHEAVFSHSSSAFLVRGVAAAGKTEVYLSAIKDALDQGSSALFLVPEIGLSHQIATTLKARFGDENVYLWTSDVPLKTRSDDWWRIKKGEFSIVVGARSAALLPLPNLGVIIVDEEQDSAYKEDRKPRFHARDLARRRAELSNAVLILGSATPSLETYESCLAGRTTLLELTERAVEATAPRIQLIDMKESKKKGFLSERLLTMIGERLKNHQQTILFLNRRGFHRYVRCANCGWHAICDKCGVTLVQHKSDLLVCHLCGTTSARPTKCPECKLPKLFSGGTGTERVEDEIKQLFPWANIARWDRDSVGKKGDAKALYEKFRRGEVEILVGTQVVAQGFNFPNLTLVGVVDADVPLHLPDFRSAEKTFQLVTQVAGRAGRELVTGDVIVQTRNPDHFALKYALAMDFAGFAEEELKYRMDLNYPPFVHLVHMQTTSKQKVRAEKDINELVEWLENGQDGQLLPFLGPNVSKRKRQGVLSAQVLVKVSIADFEGFLDRLSGFLIGRSGRFWVDVDPENLT